jgi:hypothetical protein
MTEDIRSMLTSRAKVPPRNSALKFSKQKKDEEFLSDLPLKDEEKDLSTSAEVANLEKNSAEVEKVEFAEKTSQSPSIAEELASQDKQNTQRTKTSKNDIQRSTAKSADNDSAKLTNQQESIPTVKAEAEIENVLPLSLDGTIASSRVSVPESEPSSSQSPSDLQKIQAELEKLPQIGKRLAVHLEQQIRAELLYLCDRIEITPEIFLEAAFVALQNQPKLLEEITTDAKERLAVRKRAGFLRRTKSMIDKIG